MLLYSSISSRIHLFGFWGRGGGVDNRPRLLSIRVQTSNLDTTAEYKWKFFRTSCYCCRPQTAACRPVRSLR